MSSIMDTSCCIAMMLFSDQISDHIEAWVFGRAEHVSESVDGREGSLGSHVKLPLELLLVPNRVFMSR